MTTLQAIALGLVISFIIIGSLLGFFQTAGAKLRRKRWKIGEERKIKEASQIVYPLKLETDEQVRAYIKKNYVDLPERAPWGRHLFELVKELSAAGWTTDIPLRSVNDEGRWSLCLLMDDSDLRDKLVEITEKYEDAF